MSDKNVFVGNQKLPVDHKKSIKLCGFMHSRGCKTYWNSAANNDYFK